MIIMKFLGDAVKGFFAQIAIEMLFWVLMPLVLLACFTVFQSLHITNSNTQAAILVAFIFFVGLLLIFALNSRKSAIARNEMLMSEEPQLSEKEKARQTEI